MSPAIDLSAFIHRDTKTGLNRLDLAIEGIEDTGLYAAIVTDDLGCGPGYRIVFCDQPSAPTNDTLCIIAILRLDEQLTNPMKIILQGRATIARHRLVLWAR